MPRRYIAIVFFAYTARFRRQRQIKSLLRHVKKRSLHHLSTAPTAQKMVLGGWKQHTAPPGGSRTHCARSVSFALTFFGLVLTWLVLTCFFFFFSLFFVCGCGVELPLPARHLFFFPPPFILHFLQTGVLCLCIALPFAFFFFFSAVRGTSTKLYE